MKHGISFGSIRVAAVATAVFAALLAGHASAAPMVIDILCTSTEPCGQYTGTTNDGTIFIANPHPTLPSTGTGVFQPFKRVQRSTAGGANGPLKLQNGFNTDTGQPDVNFNTKDGSQWTRSVQMWEFETVFIGGTAYIELQLDANQLGSATSQNNRITITELQIFIGSDPNLAHPESTNTGINGTGYAGTLFDANPGEGATDNTLLGLSPVWNLDSVTNGDVDVLLQASICNTPGQCGSGKGDMSVFIPLVYLGSFQPTDYFVFYSEYKHANDGFEEWRFRDAPGQQVPEPGTLALFGFGLAGLGFLRRRPKKQ